MNFDPPTPDPRDRQQARTSVHEPKGPMRPRVSLTSEQERPGGWSWEVLVEHPGGETTAHALTLSWLDHDYWCGGASAPSRVAQAIIEYVLAHREAPLPECFDAARARRWFPRIDLDLRERL